MIVIIICGICKNSDWSLDWLGAILAAVLFYYFGVGIGNLEFLGFVGEVLQKICWIISGIIAVLFVMNLFSND